MLLAAPSSPTIIPLLLIVAATSVSSSSTIALVASSKLGLPVASIASPERTFLARRCAFRICAWPVFSAPGATYLHYLEIVNSICVACAGSASGSEENWQFFGQFLSMTSRRTAKRKVGGVDSKKRKKKNGKEVRYRFRRLETRTGPFRTEPNRTLPSLPLQHLNQEGIASPRDLISGVRTVTS